MKVTVYGMGYLGHACAAWAADLGHEVSVLGAQDAGKLEPRLESLYRHYAEQGRIKYSGPCVADADVIWVTYDTPITAEGKADVEFIVNKIKALPVSCDALTIISSQVPVGTMAHLEKLLPGRRLCYIPENVRVGHAMRYFYTDLEHDRIILGTRNPADQAIVSALYQADKSRIPVLVMSPESAEMVKHAINAFLGCSIAFINEIAEACAQSGANAEHVSWGLRTEHRVGGGTLPLRPGGPFKSGHLERDLLYLRQMGDQARFPLLRAILDSNTLRQ